MTDLAMRIALSVIALAIAAAHLLVPTFTIDAVTGIALVVAILPWLRPIFKSIEIPGGIKVEFRDIEKVAKRAQATGLLLANDGPIEAASHTFLTVADLDPTLALAGLRIEIERRLDKIARMHGLTGNPRGIGNLLRFLNSRELINGSERATLEDLVALLNAAVHGAEIDPAAVDRALQIGPRILGALDDRVAARDIQYEGIS
jgi:hypothetical protein